MQTEIETNESIEPKPDFRIDSEDAANWYLRKLAAIEGEKQRVSQQSALIVKQLDADAKNLRFLYEEQLAIWAWAELKKRGGRRKSVALLQGTCAFRSIPAGLRLSDTSAAEVHAIAEGLEAAFVSKFSSSAYRELAEAALTQSGEILPGCEMAEARESFSIRFGKGGEE